MNSAASNREAWVPASNHAKPRPSCSTVERALGEVAQVEVGDLVLAAWQMASAAARGRIAEPS